MSQTLTRKEAETKSENGRPSTTSDDVHAMKLVQKHRVKILLQISLSVTVEKMRGPTGSCTVE